MPILFWDNNFLVCGFYFGFYGTLSVIRSSYRRCLFQYQISKYERLGDNIPSNSQFNMRSEIDKDWKTFLWIDLFWYYSIQKIIVWKRKKSVHSIWTLFVRLIYWPERTFKMLSVGCNLYFGQYSYFHKKGKRILVFPNGTKTISLTILHYYNNCSRSRSYIALTIDRPGFQS